MKKNALFLSTLFLLIFYCASAQPTSKKINVIAYYSGSSKYLDSFDFKKVTHLIFSFCHIKNGVLNVEDKADTIEINKMTALKAQNPSLKIMLSMGGWGGCDPCSETFSNDNSRKKFAESVKETLDYFKADGIDLDWEYPAISGFPGHKFMPADKQNFTALIIELRKLLGNKKEISFAAGGGKDYFDSSIEWDKVVPLVNRVNLMSYDLVSGYATVSGHHTPLYSTPKQLLSVDFGVKYLNSIGVPLNKIAIGAAFYGRIFANETESADGLYQPTKFLEGVSYKNISNKLMTDSSYKYHWDSIAKAPYLYNAEKKYLVTFDDPASIALKTKYVMDKGLNGVMFWELVEDKTKDGLLDVIDKTINKN